LSGQAAAACQNPVSIKTALSFTVEDHERVAGGEITVTWRL
jgi:hypothetical protein